MTGNISNLFCAEMVETYAIKSVEEGVEQVGGRDLLRLIQLVIDLVQGHLLGIDQRVAVSALAGR